MGELCVEIEDLFDGGVVSDNDGLVCDDADGLLSAIATRSSDGSMAGDGGEGGSSLGGSVGVLLKAGILLDVFGDALTLSTFLRGIIQRCE